MGAGTCARRALSRSRHRFRRPSSAWESGKEHHPPSSIEVKVTAKQFNWEFTYPGPDGKLGCADNVTIENELHVPVGKVVHLTLTSEDVIHSLWVPNFRLKQDVVPGRTIIAWFEATKAGHLRDRMLGAVRLRSLLDARRPVTVHTRAGLREVAARQRHPHDATHPAIEPTAKGIVANESSQSSRMSMHDHEPGFVRRYLFSTDHKVHRQAVHDCWPP